MGFIKKALATAAIVVPFTAVVAAPMAQAATPDVAVVVGTGNITPGLPTSGCANQSVSFNSTLAVVAGGDIQTGAIAFSGSSSICETLSNGQGSGTLSGAASGSVNYSRTGNAVTITGNATVNGNGHTIAAAACLFLPTSANPVQTYGLVCAAVLT